MVDSRSMKIRRNVSVLWLGGILAACGGDPGSAGHRGRPDSSAIASRAAPARSDSGPVARPWVPKPILVRPDPKPVPADTAPVAMADSLRTDSAAADPRGLAERTARKRLPGERRPYQLTPADSARWPVKGPAPLPGSLLPEHRIVAFYGNPKSTRMGILGQLPPEEMLPKLEQTATEWAKADPGRPVMPALHLIATVAQGKPGSGAKYRLRHSDQTIEQVLGWAEERGWLVFLDVQIGHSTVPDELARLVKYLELPYVHLALDPEFAMKLGGIPGRRIGTLDATDVNYAVRLLAEIVDRKKVPPKVL